ncbi:MAG: DUF429 domain-containing protein [Candidatus Rokubacteria bacterium]|nr:DUF429 domain-containing protein [Candidatus Rokubacteria bacterium]
MRIVGVDLAWAEHNRTGLCLVDDGRAVESAVARGDDEIVQWIGCRAAGDVVVAFDAPLVVENRDGCRGPERVIASAWGRAHASCHVANRGRPWFADGGRARRLARRLGLTIDPHAPRARRRGIEVYPHTALVSLFDLPIVLKYKAGRSRTGGVSVARTVLSRKAEFRRLVAYVAALDRRTPSMTVSASDGWRRVVAALEAAATGAALDTLEDELDAYVCAYVGLLFHERAGRTDCVVIGDAATGYVVTPIDHARWDAVRRAADRYDVNVA